MSREVIITLPDTIVINGAKDAPESLRTIKTDKWESDFIIAALSHAMSQKIGDPWSNKKNPKRGDACRAVHESMEKGEWAIRERTGATQAKFDEGIKKLNGAALYNKLSPEQLSQLAAMINADKL
jgi:tRNA uridine 5-carbamoylmethylation protein Kti12